MVKARRIAEVRAEHLLTELLTAQGWGTQRPPTGDLLRQHEYRVFPHLVDIFRGHSKGTRGGDGLPDGLLVDRADGTPLIVIENKPNTGQLDQAVKEATNVYGAACVEAGYSPLAIGLAGASEDDFDLRVFKWNGSRWVAVTYEKQPINWIPNKADTERLQASNSTELRPTIPPPEVLAERADEINRLLRESRIKDEFRPAVVAAIMLALWKSRGAIRKDPRYILGDINQECRKAFWHAKKPDLADSLRVDEANDTLAIKSRRIVTILERLNVTILTAEHDYLGQLYETFFRYTGGNTIGQYFTPRHIARMMADMCDVSKSDIVLDPACGTGGFLIATMNRLVEVDKLSRSRVVQLVKSHLIGFDDEPVTASLCIANMILRGDGSTGVRRGSCFTASDYPVGKASVVLMNPPFPHRKTDTPPEEFIDRALEGLHQGGRLAVILPGSLLVKKEEWRHKILIKNTLNGVIDLPGELFQPYASATTAIVLITKGVPHPAEHPVFFGRIENDGFRLRKGTRVARVGSQIPDIVRAYRHKAVKPGLCGVAIIGRNDEWAPGSYIPTRPLSAHDILEEAELVVRLKSSAIVKFAPQITAMLRDVQSGAVTPVPYLELSGKEASHAATPGTIGASFSIVYGQAEIEDKSWLSKGNRAIIASGGIDNGIYDFCDFDKLIAPPFVTVPRTGSIGEAHVQEWPCAVTSDCLILVPKGEIPLSTLYAAAAVLRRERWRFNYGRKITPDRIATFNLPLDEQLRDRIERYLGRAHEVERLALGITEHSKGSGDGGRKNAPAWTDESAMLSLSSEYEGSTVLELTDIRAGGRRYRMTPPLPYILRSEGDHVFAEVAEFNLYAEARDENEATVELERHLAALIEGYALEDDARLAKSGQKLKQRLLARLKPM